MKEEIGKCEACGAPLYEGDKTAIDDDGFFACRAAFRGGESDEDECYDHRLTQPA